jgi:hypothetical protein
MRQLLLDNKSAGWTAAGEVIGSGSRWHDVTQLHSDYHVSYADILPSRETLHSSSHSRGFVLAPHQPHTHTADPHTDTLTTDAHHPAALLADSSARNK